MKPVIVFDSGLGGLSVLRAIREAMPGLGIIYAADNAAFPYGELGEDEVVGRVVDVFDDLVARHDPAAAVIACNTASTLVLPHLRGRFRFPFVGTVPAIKPAASASRTGRISVLATPGTVARDYTRDLVRDFADGLEVTLVGAQHLASLSEDALAGEHVSLEDIRTEISDAFVDKDGRRTDTIVLACTHYPLILDLLKMAAPWPVDWIDPAPAIARRLMEICGEGLEAPAHEDVESLASFSDDRRLPPAVRRLIETEGLTIVQQFGPPIDRIAAKV